MTVKHTWIVHRACAFIRCLRKTLTLSGNGPNHIQSKRIWCLSQPVCLNISESNEIWQSACSCCSSQSEGNQEPPLNKTNLPNLPSPYLHRYHLDYKLHGSLCPDPQNSVMNLQKWSMYPRTTQLDAIFSCYHISLFGFLLGKAYLSRMPNWWSQWL